MNQPPTPERPDIGAPENHESLSQDEPRIYVASLSDYNAGRLLGAWINANQQHEDIQEGINEMLSRSPEPIAEEWAIHDYEGFGPLRIDEYESIEHVAKVARGIVNRGRAYAHWADYLGSSQWDQLDDFDDHFVGQADSMTEFAEQWLEDMGVDIDSLVAEHLQLYVRFDVEAFARDLSYDFHMAEDDEGVYVFDNT
jgi:antirestriction protein